MVQVQSSCSCAWNNKTPLKLIYACSGAADVGELSDQAARKLSKSGVSKMSCLAGIVGRVSGLMKFQLTTNIL